MNNTVKKNTARPFPWKCLECRQKQVQPEQFTYTTEIVHDGRIWSVTVPDLEAPRCRHCGAIVLTDDANRRISAAFRERKSYRLSEVRPPF